MGVSLLVTASAANGSAAGGSAARRRTTAATATATAASATGRACFLTKERRRIDAAQHRASETAEGRADVVHHDTAGTGVSAAAAHKTRNGHWRRHARDRHHLCGAIGASRVDITRLHLGLALRASRE